MCEETISSNVCFPWKEVTFPLTNKHNRYYGISVQKVDDRWLEIRVAPTIFPYVVENGR
jgi:hypothetical protein